MLTISIGYYDCKLTSKEMAAGLPPLLELTYTYLLTTLGKHFSSDKMLTISTSYCCSSNTIERT